jgi:hypothetical protein
MKKLYKPLNNMIRCIIFVIMVLVLVLGCCLYHCRFYFIGTKGMTVVSLLLFTIILHFRHLMRKIYSKDEMILLDITELVNDNTSRVNYEKLLQI